MMHVIATLTGELLYPFVHGYMNAKYLKQMYVSRFQGYITLVYARANAVAVVIPVDKALRMDQKTLGAWFHSEVATLHPNEVIPQMAKFWKAAQKALELARNADARETEAVPRVALPAPAR